MNARVSLSSFSIKMLLLSKMNKHLNYISASLSISVNIKFLNESKFFDGWKWDTRMYARTHNQDTSQTLGNLTKTEVNQLEVEVKILSGYEC